MKSSKRLTARTRLLVMFGALLVVCATADSALAAVSVSRAEVSGTAVRIEGTAIANRDITVDGVVMTRSDGSGRFRIDRSPFTRPGDCTVDVNDGSATASVATLSGCTVTSAPPPTSSGPPAPAPLGPANAAGVIVPLTLSWTAVTDPSGIAGYNWQISTTSTFSSLVRQDSTNGQTTQAAVGGLANGTYFWRVQAASNAFVQGAWSQARSFTVTGAAAGSLGAPSLAPLAAGTAYHPMESFPIAWTAVPGASSYVVEASRDAAFPAPVEVRFDNIPEPRYGLTFHSSLQGNWNLRIRAVDANGVAGPASNVRTFSISFNAPVGPPPTLASPANGASPPLPITLDWNDVANPQASGYEAQVSKNASFTDVEVQISGQTSSQYTLLSLTPGTKFWRVRSHQGDASPTTAAPTAWSEVRSFTVSGGTAGVASVTLTRSAGFSGEEIVGDIQLTSVAPAGGAAVQLTSTHPSATPVPATVTVPAGFAFTQFRFSFGQVTAATAATITARLGTSAATFPVTVNAPSLKDLLVSPSSVTGGTDGSAFLELNGRAPAGGATVSLTSSSPLARPPASVTVPAESFSLPLTIPTSAVQSDTIVTITATWNGKSVQAPLTLTPQVPVDVLTLDPTTTTGSNGSSGRVALAALAARDTQISLASSNPAVAQVPASVTVPAGSPHAGFLVQTTAPTTQTVVTITASSAGVTKTATLTVNPIPTAPPPPPTPLAAPTLLAPAASARFTPGQTASFDWSDVPRAASYRIQASSSTAFSSTVLDQLVTASGLSTSFTALGDRFWRVRANDQAGAPGAWSAVRDFRVKN